MPDIKTQAQKFNPLIEAFLKHPFSAFNALAIIAGGLGVWYTTQADISALSKDVSRLEKSIAENRASIGTERTSAASELRDLDTRLRSMESQLSALNVSIQFVVRQMGGTPPK